MILNSYSLLEMPETSTIFHARPVIDVSPTNKLASLRETHSVHPQLPELWRVKQLLFFVEAQNVPYPHTQNPPKAYPTTGSLLGQHFCIPKLRRGVRGLSNIWGVGVPGALAGIHQKCQAFQVLMHWGSKMFSWAPQQNWTSSLFDRGEGEFITGPGSKPSTNQPRSKGWLPAGCRQGWRILKTTFPSHLLEKHSI